MMRKKITRPDGTVIEIEGEPEELSKYEKSQDSTRRDENSRKGKRILNEERVAEMIEDALMKHLMEQPHSLSAIWIAPQTSWYPLYPNIWCDVDGNSDGAKLVYDYETHYTSCDSIC